MTPRDSIAPRSPDQRVFAILSELTGIPAGEIRSEHDLRADLGLDSLRGGELFGMLEEDLGIDLEIENAFGLRTVGSVIAMVRERVPHGP